MRSLLLLIIFIAFLWTSAAEAVIFDDGQVHNIDYQLTGNNEDVHLYNGSTLNLLQNGVIGNSLLLLDYDNGTKANILGGTVENYIYIYGGELNIMDGNIKGDVASGLEGWGEVRTKDYVKISGGTFDNPFGAKRIIYSQGISTIDIFGGHFMSNELRAIHDSTINIYGSNFNFEYGNIGVSSGVLTGILQNGEIINCDFYISDNASIILVPEPATLLLLGFGAVMLRRKRVRR